LALAAFYCAGTGKAILSAFDDNDECVWCKWLLRTASIAGVVAVIVMVSLSLRRGNTTLAIVLLSTTPVLAYMASRSWTGSLFSGIESARRYVDGVEGDHRHEWYAFRGQRVRVFLDAKQQPWFAATDIAHILDLKVDKLTFRAYGPSEYGAPESASEPYLSERGLRRLLKYSKHLDAGAIGLWLEREVLRVLEKRKEV
jgi:hypothetical protein